MERIVCISNKHDKYFDIGKHYLTPKLYTGAIYYKICDLEMVFLIWMATEHYEEMFVSISKYREERINEILG